MSEQWPETIYPDIKEAIRRRGRHSYRLVADERMHHARAVAVLISRAAQTVAQHALAAPQVCEHPRSRRSTSLT
jgi:hypothetical protein